MSPYRTPQIPAVTVESLRPFTRSCPICGSGAADWTPKPRIRGRCPWRCREEAPHAHGKCGECGAAYIMEPYEASAGRKV